MHSDLAPVWENPPPGTRRERLRSLAQSVTLSALIAFAYFVVPLEAELTQATVLLLVLGILGVSALLVWQVREILHSPYPLIRALGTLIVTLTLVLTLFATTYYLLADNDPGNFNQSLGRLDAMYFTVTILATVGFGDIVAVSDNARAVATGQMIVDIILVGMIAHVIIGAAQEGIRRQRAAQGVDDDPSTAADDRG